MAVLKKLILCCILSLLFSITHSWAKSVDTLSIDQATHSVIAPSGVAYQWYLNGEKVQGATSQSMPVDGFGLYEVEVTDMSGEVIRLGNPYALNAVGAVIKIYTIGDSTVSTYSSKEYPRTGWGQVLQNFFNSSNIQVVNKAVSGTSSKSFYNTYWTAVKNSLVTGDYVFIQFGHNDSKNGTADDLANRYTDPKTTYKEYLTKYVNETKTKGAIPVFVTSMNRNWWKNGTIDPMADYPPAMKELAASLKVPLIDLNAKSATYFNSVGQAYATSFIFLNLAAGEYANYPDGNEDNTHFQEMGAIDMARLVVEGINDLKSTASMAALISYFKPQYKITVSVNPTGSDQLTTKTASFPQGVTVTLKTIPKTTSTFQKWNDAANASIATKTLTTVVAGSAATSYAAIYKGAVIGTYDCNNTLNGTAKLDNCGRCIAGTTGKTACSSVGEAEDDACSFDGVLETKNAGFKGTAYLNVDNAIGTKITFYVNATAAGSHTLSFRYANGGTADRPATVSVDGKALTSSLSFPSTGAFTTYKAVDLTVNLSAGSHLLELASATADGLANIDQIGYVSTTVAKGSCEEVITNITEGNGTKQTVIYPNPFTEKIQLKSPETISFELTDMAGNICLSVKTNGITEFGENLPKGVYLLKIAKQNESELFKVVKE